MKLRRCPRSLTSLLALLWLCACSAWAQSQVHNPSKSRTPSTPPQVRSSSLDAPWTPTVGAMPAAAVDQAANPATDIPWLSQLSSPEILIAQQIHQGNLPCELGVIVRIQADATQAGVFHVQGKGFRYRMLPVQTSTGALRLEDKKAGAVWLQLANKSMLMDQKRGRRMVDDCVHPHQLAVAEAMKTNPPPSLIDTQGMGR
ncbi:MAG: hypothetical protein ACK52H_01425 [Burkholderiales bacterium]|jgi:hypothetical protein